MNIDIWMDITCPFCYIGTTQLHKALEAFEHANEVTVIHHSFQLDPSAPTETKETLNEMLARRKNISLEEAAQLNTNVTEYAASVGLPMNIEKAVPVNSFAAHRLIHLAAKDGKQSEIIQRLFKAYFKDGKNIASMDTLTELGADVGLDAEQTRTTLEKDTYTDEVQKDIAQATQYGIHGVPFFIIDNKYTISGAQGINVFSEALQKAWKETHK